MTRALALVSAVKAGSLPAFKEALQQEYQYIDYAYFDIPADIVPSGPAVIALKQKIAPIAQAICILAKENPQFINASTEAQFPLAEIIFYLQSYVDACFPEKQRSHALTIRILVSFLETYADDQLQEPLTQIVDWLKKQARLPAAYFMLSDELSPLLGQVKVIYLDVCIFFAFTILRLELFSLMPADVQQHIRKEVIEFLQKNRAAFQEFSPETSPIFTVNWLLVIYLRSRVILLQRQNNPTDALYVRSIFHAGHAWSSSLCEFFERLYQEAKQAICDNPKVNLSDRITTALADLLQFHGSLNDGIFRNLPNILNGYNKSFSTAVPVIIQEMSPTVRGRYFKSSIDSDCLDGLTKDAPYRHILHLIITSPSLSSEVRRDMVTALLNGRRELQVLDVDGKSPLSLALEQQQQDVVSLLLKAISAKFYHDSKLDGMPDDLTIDCCGKSLLFLAYECEQGMRRLTRYLAQKGASLFNLNKEKDSLFTLLARSPSPERYQDIEVLVFDTPALEDTISRVSSGTASLYRERPAGYEGVEAYYAALTERAIRLGDIPFLEFLFGLSLAEESNNQLFMQINIEKCLVVGERDLLKAQMHVLDCYLMTTGIFKKVERLTKALHWVWSRTRAHYREVGLLALLDTLDRKHHQWVTIEFNKRFERAKINLTAEMTDETLQSLRKEAAKSIEGLSAYYAALDAQTAQLAPYQNYMKEINAYDRKIAFLQKFVESELDPKSIRDQQVVIPAILIEKKKDRIALVNYLPENFVPPLLINGKTLLMFAVRYGQWATARYLIGTLQDPFQERGVTYTIHRLAVDAKFHPKAFKEVKYAGDYLLIQQEGHPEFQFYLCLHDGSLELVVIKNPAIFRSLLLGLADISNPTLMTLTAVQFDTVVTQNGGHVHLERMCKHPEAGALWDECKAWNNRSLIELQAARVQQNSSSAAGPELPGLQFQEIPGDGHCLYHAVGIHVGQDQANLRRIVATYIERNKESLGESLELAPHQSVEDYLQGIRLGGEWATHVEIEVLMRLLDRPILVINSAHQIVNREDANRFEGDPIFVAYNGYNHYNAWLLDGTLSPRDILHAMQRGVEITGFNKDSSQPKWRDLWVLMQLNYRFRCYSMIEHFYQQEMAEAIKAGNLSKMQALLPKSGLWSEFSESCLPIYQEMLDSQHVSYTKTPHILFYPSPFYEIRIAASISQLRGALVFFPDIQSEIQDELSGEEQLEQSHLWLKTQKNLVIARLLKTAPPHISPNAVIAPEGYTLFTLACIRYKEVLMEIDALGGDEGTLANLNIHNFPSAGGFYRIINELFYYRAHPLAPHQRELPTPADILIKDVRNVSVAHLVTDLVSGGIYSLSDTQEQEKALARLINVPPAQLFVSAEEQDRTFRTQLRGVLKSLNEIYLRELKDLSINRTTKLAKELKGLSGKQRERVIEKDKRLKDFLEKVATALGMFKDELVHAETTRYDDGLKIFVRVLVKQPFMATEAYRGEKTRLETLLGCVAIVSRASAEFNILVQGMAASFNRVVAMQSEMMRSQREMASEVHVLRETVAEQREELSATKGKLAEQAEELVETKGKLAEQVEELVETKGKLAEQVKELVGIKKTNAEQAKEIEQLKQDLAERERQLKEDLRKEMREMMRELQAGKQGSAGPEGAAGFEGETGRSRVSASLFG